MKGKTDRVKRLPIQRLFRTAKNAKKLFYIIISQDRLQVLE